MYKKVWINWFTKYYTSRKNLEKHFRPSNLLWIELFIYKKDENENWIDISKEYI